MARGGRLLQALQRIARRATAASLFDTLAEIYGHQVFLTLEEPLELEVARGRELTFQQVADAVARLAGGLQALGVEPGDRVALCAENRIDYSLVLFAIMRCGAVGVPLHHHLTRGEVGELVERSAARFLVCDPRVASDAATVIGLEPGGALDRASVRAAPLAALNIDDDDVVAILFTSGTTGAPKGAQLTSRSLLAATRLAALMPDGAEEQGVCGLPQAHIMALSTLLAVAMSGARLHWMARFDPPRVLDALVQLRATFFIGVPAMYAMLAELEPEGRDLSRMKLWISGADAMPPALVERFRRLGCVLRSVTGTPQLTSLFVEIYGMVELSGPAILRFWPPTRHPDSRSAALRRFAERFQPAAELLGGKLPGPAGVLGEAKSGSAVTLAIPPYKLRVVDDKGKPAKAGVVGELVVKGPGVTKGYLNDPAATARTTKDGWLFTGDLAKRSRLGQISFVSRKKDVIKHGGYSVFPAEIEAGLTRHPDVAEAVVLGAPHPTKGAVPVAVVVLKKQSEVTEQELLAWCRESFAAYKAPRALVVVEASAIPRNDNRKVLKGALLDEVLPVMQRRYPAVFASRASRG